MTGSIRLVVLGVCLCAVGAAAARDASIESVRTALQKSSSDLAVHDLRKAPIEGWFHAVLGGTSGYVSADGATSSPETCSTCRRARTSASRSAASRAAMCCEPSIRRRRSSSRRARFGTRHGLHRCRLWLLPQASQPDRALQRARDSGALPRVSAQRTWHRVVAEDGSSLVLRGSCCRADEGEAGRNRDAAQPTARRMRSLVITSSPTSWASPARR